ncbi:MAG: AsnC family protein [Atopobiaceae bacterium]|nr:AsnC family protein [Atopobiaceae bacterium]
MDARILSALSRNPSLNARELSSMLGETYDTVRYWLRKLEPT